MGFSHYAQNKVLDHVFGGTTYTPPATLLVGLSTSEIQNDGTGISEPGGGGYARVSVSNTASAWADAVTHEPMDRGVKTNTEQIEFPEATGAWGVISHFFIMAGSDLIGHGELSTAKEIHTGDTARFRPGELHITLE